jgi:Caspase domain
MPKLNPIKKAMIVIAVSQYEPPYQSLPGALTSAARIAQWAKGAGPGRDYAVIEITDSQGEAVTVERLKTEITVLLESTPIDRLVVYFAGHGLVRSAVDQFWLLTRAGIDNAEGVDFYPFVEGLKRYGIGASNSDLVKGQLCIIADACRNTHRNVLSFQGSPILTRAGKAVELQTDLFMATTLGYYAFQPKAVDGRPAYCLFSDVLCDALERKVPAVVDAKHHPFKPVILNSLLGDYLDTEVPRRAAIFKEIMQPDTITGIRAVHTGS